MKVLIAPSDGRIVAARESWEHEGSEEEGDEGSGFPRGEHPLEGVSNLEDLAAPETLSAKVDLSEVGAFCGCQSNWVLELQ